MARKVSIILLVLLSLFLIGTGIVLSTTKAYLRIDDWAYITENDIPITAGHTNGTSSDEIVPRILHQTWKTEQLPDRWVAPSKHCRELMPDYEYVLWTDATSRQLIAEHYPWFLSTYDGYKYNIQRADAIRYFVLHRFGGVYMDLDIGCIRPIDPLLKYQVILPKTIPVGVSNDLMLSTPGHPFMEQVIHGLITFNWNYILNYPTVMFSTGPMFMSAQYGFYTASHPPTSENPGGDVRILPKALYGKNAKEGEAPHSFFKHFYGSSWHSDDAWLWTFLGLWGMRLMYFATFCAMIAGIKMYFFRKKGSGRGRRLMFGRYEVLLPRFVYDRETGSPQLDLGYFSAFAPGHSREVSSASSVSPTSSEPTSPQDTPRLGPSAIPVPLDLGLASPTLSTESSTSESNAVTDALKRAGTWVADTITGHSRASSGSQPPYGRRNSNAPRPSANVTARSNRRRRPRGILFFLPAIFTPSRQATDIEAISLPLVDERSSRQSSRSRTPLASRARTPVPLTKEEEAELESVPLMGDMLSASERPSGSRRTSFSNPANVPPPPYASSRIVGQAAAWNGASASNSETWNEWSSSQDEIRR